MASLPCQADTYPKGPPVSRAARHLLGIRSPVGCKGASYVIRLTHPHHSCLGKPSLLGGVEKSSRGPIAVGFKEARSELCSFSLLFMNTTAGQAIE